MDTVYVFQTERGAAMFLSSALAAGLEAERIGNVVMAHYYTHKTVDENYYITEQPLCQATTIKTQFTS